MGSEKQEKEKLAAAKNSPQVKSEAPGTPVAGSPAKTPQVSAATPVKIPEVPAKQPETPSSEAPAKQPEDVEMKDVSGVSLGETPNKTPAKSQPLEDAAPVDPLIKKLFTETPTPSFSRYSTAAKKEVAGLGNNR